MTLGHLQVFFTCNIGGIRIIKKALAFFDSMFRFHRTKNNQKLLAVLRFGDARSSEDNDDEE